MMMTKKSIQSKNLSFQKLRIWELLHFDKIYRKMIVVPKP
ncbi:hypothetical protein LEP1GSC043_1743 [Leptospira weilii str. Ecochallenge]|uniref:Uncharacterized protein n=1 Tax=Leptospira weilii str. Ecochallenge TaxID=1049986 RepID=N1UAQ1_9LEPT|nr:hypothetical protein LEP1GSC043_1743 [Leptospira weilii str. Ecochallenge]